MARPALGEGQKQQPECPDCGHAYSRYMEKVWANDGTVPVRTYSCPNRCGNYMTAEVVIPKGMTTQHGLDEHYRTERARMNRAKFGYQPSGNRGNPYLSSDRLVWTMRVIKGMRRRANGVRERVRITPQRTASTVHMPPMLGDGNTGE